MSKETSYSAIVLKKQPIGEADELITFFTQEKGKIRALAKAVKQASSKLAFSLQAAFLIRLTVAGSQLPKIIHVEVLNSHKELRNHQERISIWFVACELVLKGTGDEQKNEAVFALLLSLLRFLNLSELNANSLEISLIKFQLEFLASSGLGIWFPTDKDASPRFFSNSRGGFFKSRETGDSIAIDNHTWDNLVAIRQTPFSHLQNLNLKAVEPLHKLLTSFVEYQLEREVKSEKFLKSL